MEWNWHDGTYWYCFTSISTYQPKELPNINLNFQSKMTFPPCLWPHLKAFENYVQKSKIKCCLSNPLTITTFHQYTSFTIYLYFLRYKPISTFIPHIFCTFKFELVRLDTWKCFLTFWPMCTKHTTLILLVREYLWQRTAKTIGRKKMKRNVEVCRLAKVAGSTLQGENEQSKKHQVPCVSRLQNQVEGTRRQPI